MKYEPVKWNAMHCATAGSDWLRQALSTSRLGDGQMGRQGGINGAATSKPDLPLVPSLSAAHQPPPPDTSLSPGSSAKAVTPRRPLASHFPPFFLKGSGSWGTSWAWDHRTFFFLSASVYLINQDAPRLPAISQWWMATGHPTDSQAADAI